MVPTVPASSPELNPIESCWLKVKTHPRASGARTHASLSDAMQTALPAVRPQDASAGFAYRGDPPQPP